MTNLHRGIIRNVQRQNNFLSLIRLELIFDSELENTIPIYALVPEDLVGRDVDIFIKRIDDTIYQEIVGNDFNIGFYCGINIACKILSDYVHGR